MTATKLPSLPSAIHERNLVEAVRTIKQVLDVWRGERADPLDQVVTFRSLDESGFDVTRPRAPGQVPIVTPPGDGEQDRTRPPAPAGFQVTAGLGSVLLSWDSPLAYYANHAYTAVWRSQTNDLGTATLQDRAPGFLWVDFNVTQGETYFYWIRWVSTSDVVGPWNSLNGTAGTVSMDPGYMLELLTGEITESQLYNALNSRINLIDGPASLAGSVNARTAILQSEIDAIQSQLADIEGLPEFDADLDWDEGAIVKYEGALYRAIQGMTNPSPLPTDTDYWEKIGDYASLGEAVSVIAAQVADHETRITTAEGTISAHSTSISTLQSGLSAAEGDISANAVWIAGVEATVTQQGNSITSITTSLNSLSAQVNDANTGLNTKAAITYVDQAVANETSARTTAINQLSATVNDNTAAIETKADTSVVTDLSGQVTSINAQYTIKVDANGVIAGIGLMTDGNTSQVGILADRFYIAHPGAQGANLIPFVVDGNNVFISNASIKNATITVAKIQDAFLDNLTADKGTLAQARIQQGDIFNLTIGDEIRSSNYSAGNDGWRAAKDGTVEFNNATFRGHVEAASGTFAGSLQAATGSFIGDVVANTLQINPDGVVETRHIGLQQVSFAVGAYTAGDITVQGDALWGSWVTVQTVAVASTGAPIFILATLVTDVLVALSSSTDTEWRITENGSEIYVFPGAFADYDGSAERMSSIMAPMSGSASLMRQPGAGTRTYRLQMRVRGSPGTGYARRRSLVVLETKR